ncbi:DUF4176 domain-containing protein [Lactovum odontotermitis]
MSEEAPELLPLGSAVKIRGDDSIYILISRGFQKKDGEMLAGYAGVPHPYGESKKYKTVTIATSNILEVVHRGYEDALDRDFVQEQLGQALDAPAPLTTPDPSDEVIVVVSKEETQTVPAAPPAIEPEKTALPGVPEHPHDPFYNLTHKAKENKK